MNEKILVVDDEAAIRELIALYLEKESFQVTTCSCGSEALQQIRKTLFDLAILDIMLPDVDGFSLCEAIRNAFSYPIIMLTAKDEASDKIRGLSLGADDYLTKPFLPLEMVARVKAQIRRYKYYNKNASASSDILSHGGLTLNVRTHECILNERPLELTPTEFEILKLLLAHKGEVVSAEQLFYSLWGDDYYTKNTNTITVHIRHLREKMDDSFENPKYIRTVWGYGYKIEN